MTASAWTPTPPPTSTPNPTLTPTPVPYDLTVTVMDESGAPVSRANIVFPESGDEKPVQVDEQGNYSWTDLPGETGSLTVSAQGYFPAEQPLDLQRGSNLVEVALQRDPNGLLPSEACAPNESILYVEDFQDGEVNNWSLSP